MLTLISYKEHKIGSRAIYRNSAYEVTIYSDEYGVSIKTVPLKKVLQPNIEMRSEDILLTFGNPNGFNGDVELEYVNEFIKNVREAEQLALYIKQNIDFLKKGVIPEMG